MKCPKNILMRNSPVTYILPPLSLGGTLMSLYTTGPECRTFSSQRYFCFLTFDWTKVGPALPPFSLVIFSITAALSNKAKFFSKSKSSKNESTGALKQSKSSLVGFLRFSIFFGVDCFLDFVSDAEITN